MAIIPSHAVSISTTAIGSGAAGVVFKAKYANETVVVKRLRVQSLSGSARLEFEREATTLSKINHPRIVRFLGVVLDQEQYSIVLEYLPLGSMYAFYTSNSIVPYPNRLPSPLILHPSLNILMYVDAVGELHAKITDFGIAVVQEATATNAIAVREENGDEGGSKGTLIWMAPELHMELPDDVPASVSQLIQSCISIDPSSRPSFTAISAQLASFSEGVTVKPVGDMLDDKFATRDFDVTDTSLLSGSGMYTNTIASSQASSVYVPMASMRLPSPAATPAPSNVASEPWPEPAPYVPPLPQHSSTEPTLPQSYTNTLPNSQQHTTSSVPPTQPTPSYQSGAHQQHRPPQPSQPPQQTAPSSYVTSKPPPPSNSYAFYIRQSPARAVIFTIIIAFFLTFIVVVILLVTGIISTRPSSSSAPLPTLPSSRPSTMTQPSNFPTNFPGFPTSSPAPTTTSLPSGTTLTPTSLLNQRFHISSSKFTGVSLLSVALSSCLTNGPPSSGGFTADLRDCQLSGVSVNSDGRIVMSLGDCLGRDLVYRVCLNTTDSVWSFVTV
ncbi:kinase-like domain-containing protein [Chytridium lagenaria]|nr:kinase-like domain-containing protein [Chytridium lagenaria]